MDIGSLRPVVTGITAPVPKAPAAAEQATETDLPVGSVVTETGSSANDGDTFANPNGGNSAFDVSGSSGSGSTLRSTFHIDESTHSLIFRTIDPATGTVVSQIPEESRLRFQEMLSSWTSSKGEASATTEEAIA